MGYIETASPSLKPFVIDHSTGEILHEETDRLSFQLSKLGKHNKTGRRRVIRGYRFKVQRIARTVLMETVTPKGNRWRVCDCHRLPVPRVQDVIVSASPVTGNAVVRNLVKCGQVWTCPVCASKIAVVRRDEVREALDKQLDGGQLALSITLTVRHGVGHSAKRLLSGMDGALRRMRANRRVQQLCKQYGYRGQIRALEVTYGDANGWHPHFHLIWFFDSKLWSDSTAEAFHRVLSACWIKAVVTGGLPEPTADIGVVVKRIETARDYEGKGIASIDGVDDWDAADELTRAVAKTAKAGRMSPFDLLCEGRFDLFQEYARAFHGKRQLTWSPGLKPHFGIGEKSDEEIADEEEAEGVAVLAVPHKEWLRAIRFRADLVGQLLDRVELDGATSAVAWLRSCGIDARALSPP